MPHNIVFNEKTGQHSFFSVQQKAWHGLGQIVDNYPTSKEAIQYAGLDYTVVKKPNIHRFDDGTELVSETSFFTSRNDNNAVLGDRIGKDYNVVQNADAFTFFDAIVDGDGIFYETAGALGKGEQIFITAKLPGYIRVGHDDMIEKYLFLTTAHDGKGSIIAAFTPIRIVCNNTLNAALKNCSNSVIIRHTASASEKLKEAHKIMGISNTMSIELESIFNQWTKVKITDKQVLQLIQQAMCPSKEVYNAIKNGEELSTAFTNICTNAFRYAMESPTQDTLTAKGTLFGAFNGITGYFQNIKEYKDDDAKVKSLMLGGTGQQRTQAAFDLCTSFAKNGADILIGN